MAETPEFKAWHKMECARRMGSKQEAEYKVEKMMDPKNLIIEVQDENGNWVLEAAQ